MLYAFADNSDSDVKHRKFIQIYCHCCPQYNHFSPTREWVIKYRHLYSQTRTLLNLWDWQCNVEHSLNVSCSEVRSQSGKWLFNSKSKVEDILQQILEIMISNSFVITLPKCVIALKATSNTIGLSLSDISCTIFKYLQNILKIVKRLLKIGQIRRQGLVDKNRSQWAWFIPKSNKNLRLHNSRTKNWVRWSPVKTKLWSVSLTCVAKVADNFYSLF